MTQVVFTSQLSVLFIYSDDNPRRTNSTATIIKWVGWVVFCTSSRKYVIITGKEITNIHNTSTIIKSILKIK